MNNTSTASTTVNVNNHLIISAVSTSTASSSAVISWTTNNAASSQVSYGLTSAYGSSTATSTLATSHTITLTNLTSSTTYHYQILSTDAQANTATTTDATFYIDVAPSTPTGLTATSTSASQINLAWASSTDNVAVLGYDVYRNGVKVATSSGASYSDTGLNASTTYTYYVDAFNTAGETSPTSTTVIGSTQGVNIYIAQNATGTASGLDCNDAYGVGFFNTSSNWASTSTVGKISPGATIHLCGTFTGTAGSTMLTTQGNGVSGSSITILFEPGANLTNPAYWGDNINGAIQITNNWITVDGERMV